MAFFRLLVGDRDRLIQACESLLTITKGLPTERQLSAAETGYLSDWLKSNADISADWPGDVFFEKVNTVLADGRITEDAGKRLVAMLQEIWDGLGGSGWTTGLG